MKREEKNAISRQRILDAALKEFSEKGYGGASLNTVCAENAISKGIIYHYFKDKDELYLLCVTDCFNTLTAYMKAMQEDVSATIERRLSAYFDARLRFFAENPLYLGVFLDVVLNPPAHLAMQIANARDAFDALNISVLTALLESAPLRKGLSAAAVTEDFRMYMDFFNARFRVALADAVTPEDALREHEERSHRQLSILLHGVLEHQDEKD
ncbi:TetR/AcrR family transcriptional regulator [Hespellia stercorisuis]|uniref:Transcriptional regulator, TetR family n=1 Tax=Hespellia stercorisuis DSM 15480 TaxID=1121950 RepID=A0A1M6SHG1_9FIRM|nr:TetR/AcrR family transcriptional regulator [Hespellia stercorisuis]SHK44204.1 transcriptional regulator, TetR family [Hespellia stercorisuis DSM 15480]